MGETRITTGKVRLSYEHVFKPVQINGEGEPKYSASLLIPKGSKVTLKAIEEAIDAAIQVGVDKGHWPAGIKKSKLKLPLRDGDDDKDEDEAYQGMFFLNATSKSKPAVVDVERQKIDDESDVYSGCFVRANINFYPFKVSGNMGIAVGLNSIQKLDDGTPFGGGRSNPDEDFKDEKYEDEFDIFN